MVFPARYIVRDLQAVWGPDYGNEVVYLRVFINQLPKIIEPEPGKPRYILTEPCIRYQFHVPDAAEDPAESQRGLSRLKPRLKLWLKARLGPPPAHL